MSTRVPIIVVAIALLLTGFAWRGLSQRALEPRLQEQIERLSNDMANQQKIIEQLKHAEFIPEQADARTPKTQSGTINLLFMPLDGGLKATLGLTDDQWSQIEALNKSAVTKSREIFSKFSTKQLSPTEFSRAMTTLQCERDEQVYAMLSKEQRTQMRTYMRAVEIKYQEERMQRVHATATPVSPPKLLDSASDNDNF